MLMQHPLSQDQLPILKRTPTYVLLSYYIQQSKAAGDVPTEQEQQRTPTAPTSTDDDEFQLDDDEIWQSPGVGTGGGDGDDDDSSGDGKFDWSPTSLSKQIETN